MSAEFTPGPWASDASVAFHDRPDLPCVVDEHRLVIAQCWDDGHSEEECEANAHLIAAAPDYHSACGGALDPGEADTCGPLAWLKCAVDALGKTDVMDAVMASDGSDDPDAYWEMVNEVTGLLRNLTAAYRKARGK